MRGEKLLGEVWCVDKPSRRRLLMAKGAVCMCVERMVGRSAEGAIEHNVGSLSFVLMRNRG